MEKAGHSVIINNKTFRVADILDMLDRVNKIANIKDDITCLRESIHSYIYEIQEFFKLRNNERNVLQGYLREVGCTKCIKCNTTLTTENYEFIERDLEFLCKNCIDKEHKAWLMAMGN